jgi:hypothetical protein
MKKMLMVALVMMSASVFAKNPHHVKVISKMNEVVYFKVDNSMVGAFIEIYDNNGALIHSDKVTGKRMIVDFYAEPSGSYKIHVHLNGSDQVIEYNKSSESHADLSSKDHVSVSQL